MKLLICTQIVDKNDPILGSFHRWIEEFAKHADKVTVVCLKKGSYSLPANVKVYSLGKERGVSKLTYLLNFYQYIIRFRHEYDAVLVHMNPIYVVLAGPLWRWWKKRIGLWYLHRSVDLKLRIAERFVHYIFTASKESFRLKSAKTRITGHAIDTEFFKPKSDVSASEVPVLITTGRLSPIKNVHVLLKAAKLLRERGIAYQLQIIGGAGTPEQQDYEERLRQYTKDNNLSEVSFLGEISYLEIPLHLQRANLFVNLSGTGSIDKAILEAMATGLLVLTSNEAHHALLSFDNRLLTDNNPEHIADAVEKILSADMVSLRQSLRGLVVKDHSLPHTIADIVRLLS